MAFTRRSPRHSRNPSGVHHIADDTANARRFIRWNPSRKEISLPERPPSEYPGVKPLHAPNRMGKTVITALSPHLWTEGNESVGS